MKSQSFLPQKSKEEGPKISQIRGHIHPHSIKWVCDFNQCRIQSPSSDRATTAAGCRDHIQAASPILPWTPGGNPNFPPCGKRSSRLGASFLSQAHPTHSRRHIHAHAWPLRILSPIGYAWLPPAIVPNLPRVSPMGAPPLLPSGQKVSLCPLVSAPHETLCYMTMKMRRRRREDSCARHFRVINSHNSNLCHTEHD